VSGQLGFITTFDRVVNSNVATLEYAFDNALAFENFYPAEGVQVLDVESGEGFARITVMVPDYNTQTFGELRLETVDILENSRQYNVAVSVELVLQAGDTKRLVSGITASTGITGVSLRGDFNGDGVVDLIDLSMIVDAFGATPGDARWNPLMDLNGNGIIDIQDIVYVARKI